MAECRHRRRHDLARRECQHPAVVAAVADPAWHVAGVGDFDGDGRDDIAWRNLGDGRVSLWPSANIAQARALPVIALPWTIAGVGDLDGDGRDDLVWRQLNTGADVAWRSGDPTLALAITGVTKQEWIIAAVDDFDGDGRADLLWRQVYDGRNVLWHGGASTSSTTMATVDFTWGVAASGDFDGDGRSDLLWRQFRVCRNVLWHGADIQDAQVLSTASAGSWLAVPYEGERAQSPDIRTASGARRRQRGPRCTLAPRAVPRKRAAHRLRHTGKPRASRSTRRRVGEDFAFAAPSAGRIRIGETEVNVPLNIRGDANAEANEIFPYLSLGTRNGVEVESGRGVIRNDDANAVWIENANTVEGDAGTRPVTVRVNLSRPQATPVSFDIETEIATDAGFFAAFPGNDYIDKSMTGAVIPAGAIRFDFVVDVVGDRQREYYVEPFDVVITQVSGAVLIGQPGRVSIADNDNPFP
jgi:hypothetical protein